MILDGREAEELLEFLRESNAIENVFDDDSLQQAIYAWSYIITQKKLTPGVVLKTHKILMLHQKLLPDQKGYLRRVGVSVAGRPGQDWRELPKSLKHWCTRVQYTIDNIVLYAKDRLEQETRLHHIQYEHMHPFVDGNGRTGRIFMNWERLQLGLPLLIIHAGEEQQEYYKWF